MTGPEGDSEFCFPRIVEGNIEIRRKQNLLFPKGPVICYIAKQNKSKIWKSRWDSGDHMQQHSNFVGNSELLPIWCHSFRNVARPQGVH